MSTPSGSKRPATEDAIGAPPTKKARLVVPGRSMEAISDLTIILPFGEMIWGVRAYLFRASKVFAVAMTSGRAKASPDLAGKYRWVVGADTPGASAAKDYFSIRARGGVPLQLEVSVLCELLILSDYMEDPKFAKVCLERITTSVANMGNYTRKDLDGVYAIASQVQYKETVEDAVMGGRALALDAYQPIVVNAYTEGADLTPAGLWLEQLAATMAKNACLQMDRYADRKIGNTISIALGFTDFMYDSGWTRYLDEFGPYTTRDLVGYSKFHAVSNLSHCQVLHWTTSWQCERLDTAWNLL